MLVGLRNGQLSGTVQACLLPGKTTEHVDCDIRAEFGSKRRIFRRLWNVEPIAIHNIASRADGPENIISSHLLPDRLRADPGEHYHFGICLAGLRCRLTDKPCI